MKNRTPSLVVLLAALGAALSGPLASAAPTPSAAFYRVRTVEYQGIPVVEAGDSAVRVVANLGEPEQILSAEQWVYRRFRSLPTREQAAEGCTILLVTLRDGRVSEMRRVNEAGVQLIAARVAAPSPNQVIARK